MPLIDVTTLADARLEPYVGVSDPVMLRNGGRFIAEGREVVRRLLASGLWRTESVLVSPAALEQLSAVLAPHLRRGCFRCTAGYHQSTDRVQYPSGLSRCWRKGGSLPARRSRPAQVTRRRQLSCSMASPTPTTSGIVPECAGVWRRGGAVVADLVRSALSEGDPDLDGCVAWSSRSRDWPAGPSRCSY